MEQQLASKRVEFLQARLHVRIVRRNFQDDILRPKKSIFFKISIN